MTITFPTLYAANHPFAPDPPRTTPCAERERERERECALLPYCAGRSDCVRLQCLRPRFYHYDSIELYTAVVK